jgi:hypothetical protein
MPDSTRPDAPIADHPSHPTAEAALAGPAKGSTAAIDDPPPEHLSPSLREALFGEERLLEQERLTRRSRWSNWTVLAMLILCFFVLVRFPAREARPVRKHFAPTTSQTLDELRLQQLGGTATVGLPDLSDKVVLLLFWSPADEQCRRELPALLDMVRPWTENPEVRFLPVACSNDDGEDTTDLFNETQQYLREFGISLRTYCDPRGVTRDAATRAVGLAGLPTTLLLDRRGRIRAAWQGLGSESASDIDDQLDKTVHGE